MLGAPGSPYSRKMRSLLRFRRIPYVFILQNSRESQALPVPKVPLLPTFLLPGDDGELAPVTDSTPLIRRFEEALVERSVMPPDPGLAFINDLLEDYADEWLTKCMFHYRWYHEADATKARHVLPHWAMTDFSNEEMAPIQKMIGDRQIDRLGVVGSNDTTASVIEESYLRFLSVFDQQLQESRFLFGRRPSSSDFALMGQLTCLALFDPTPSAIAANQFPRVYGWTEVMEDLSGMEVAEEDWFDPSEVTQSLRSFLGEVGHYYAPFLLANSEALEAGLDRVETEISGCAWVQKPFPYQGKCLKWLREGYVSLAPEARETVNGLIEGTGCEALFA